MAERLRTVVDDRRGSPLVARITGVRKGLSQSFGFVVPQFRVRDALDMPPNDYRVLLGGVPLGGATVLADKVLAIDAGDAREGHNLPGVPTVDPSFGCPALWIDPGQRDHAVAEGFLTVDPGTVIATHLNQLLGERPQPRARRALAALLRLRAPACTVLSIAELPAAQPIEVLAVIGGPQAAQEPAALPSPQSTPLEEIAA